MKQTISALLVLVALLQACASVAPSVAPPLTSRKIRVGIPSLPTVRNVPLYMALDALRMQGYQVETVTLARFDLVPVALANGEIDFGSFSPQGGWAAIAQGAPLETIVAQFSPTWALVVSDKVETCADLGKYPIGYSATTGIQQAMLTRYVNQNCPGTVPQIVVAGDPDARLVALLAGQLDGSPLEPEAQLQVDQTAPGKFHRVFHAARDFPDIQIATFAVRRAWGQQNPEVVRDFVRALITAHRRVNDNPQLLRDEIAKQHGFDAARAQYLADAYLQEKTWEPNGGLTPENIQLTLDLLKSIGALPPEIQVKDVANLSYLNQVLSEIGRK